VTKKASAEASEQDSPAPTVAVLDETAPLRNFYQQELKPFLERPAARGSALGDAAQARSAFTQLRTLVPASLHTTIEDLEGICEEERSSLCKATCTYGCMDGCCCTFPFR